MSLVGAFADRALTWASSRGSRETRVAYARDLRSWFEHCERAGADPGAPPPGVVVSFRDELSARYAPLSVRRTLAALSAAFSALSDGPNPFSERALPRPPASSYSRTEALPDEVARALVDAAASREGPLARRDEALLRVLWSTGMRCVGVVSVRRDGVLRRDGITSLRHTLKGGVETETELSPEAARSVDEWLAVAPASRWLFCAADGARPMSRQLVEKAVARAAAAAGAEAHPHQFRSALITDALDAGVPLERVRDFVGHRDIRSTLRYDRGRRGAGVAADVARHRAARRG